MQLDQDGGLHQQALVIKVQISDAMVRYVLVVNISGVSILFKEVEEMR